MASTIKAVVIKEEGVSAVECIAPQSMRPGYVKVKTIAVAVNPTDYHHRTAVGRIGGILGCDLSGIVEEVGADCKTSVKKGDKIFGVCHGANHNNAEDGSFAEYAMVRDGHLAPIPGNMSFEEAATLGVGITTVGQALYMTLKLPLPTEPAKEPLPVLIYGGSTATGTLAIQYAKLSGLRVITTASPKNFDLVKSRGADVVFDYNDPRCGSKIQEHTEGKLCYALDNISTASSFKICAEAFPARGTDESIEESKKRLHLVSLLPLDDWPRDDIDAQAILAYSTFGEAFTKFDMEFPAIPQHFEFGVMFWKLSAQLLGEGKIIPHPLTLGEGGLGGIGQGITKVFNNEVSGTKLVYRVEDISTVGSYDISGKEHNYKLSSNW